MSSFWTHVVVAGTVVVIAMVVAKVIDVRITRRGLTAEAATRYGVLRRTIFGAIIFIGVLSALLVIPEVRALAGGILASSAVVGLVIGFAAQRTFRQLHRRASDRIRPAVAARRRGRDRR